MRCHTDALNSSKTLDNLCAGLLKEGYVSSCQSLYLRLILSRANNTEGKQHVQPVPVKFHKAQDNIQNRHTDEDLAFATTGFLWDIVRLFVSKRVCSFSRWQNKGTNQCNSSNQASTTHNVCLMKFDCQTTTLWSPSNKLNFPVYAGFKIWSPSAWADPEILNSRPTYIAIRSPKNDFSTVYFHRTDWNRWRWNWWKWWKWKSLKIRQNQWFD